MSSAGAGKHADRARHGRAASAETIGKCKARCCRSTAAAAPPDVPSYYGGLRTSRRGRFRPRKASSAHGHGPRDDAARRGPAVRRDCRGPGDDAARRCPAAAAETVRGIAAEGPALRKPHDDGNAAPTRHHDILRPPRWTWARGNGLGPARDRPAGDRPADRRRRRGYGPGISRRAPSAAGCPTRSTRGARARTCAARRRSASASGAGLGRGRSRPGWQLHPVPERWPSGSSHLMTEGRLVFCSGRGAAFSKCDAMTGNATLITATRARTSARDHIPIDSCDAGFSFCCGPCAVAQMTVHDHGPSAGASAEAGGIQGARSARALRPTTRYAPKDADATRHSRCQRRVAAVHAHRMRACGRRVTDGAKFTVLSRGSRRRPAVMSLPTSWRTRRPRAETHETLGAISPRERRALHLRARFRVRAPGCRPPRRIAAMPRPAAFG